MADERDISGELQAEAALIAAAGRSRASFLLLLLAVVPFIVAAGITLGLGSSLPTWAVLALLGGGFAAFLVIAAVALAVGLPAKRAYRELASIVAARHGATLVRVTGGAVIVRG